MIDDDKTLPHLLRRDARAINEADLVLAAGRARRAAKLIESQAILINRFTLRWSNERPTVPGHYWIKDKRNPNATKGIIGPSTVMGMPDDMARDYLFSGPLPEPIDSEDTNQS